VESKKIDGKYCADETIPRHIEVCVEKPCTSWFLGNWSMVNNKSLFSIGDQKKDLMATETVKSEENKF